MACMELDSLPGTPILITGHKHGKIIIRDVKAGFKVLAVIVQTQPGDGHPAGDVRVIAQGPMDIFFSGGDDGKMSVWQCVLTPPA